LLETSQALKDFSERKSRHAAIALPTNFMQTKATVTSLGVVYPEQLPGIITPVTRRMTIRQLLPSIPVTSGSVAYIQETAFSNTAATVSETTLKPYGDMTFQTKTASVAVLAFLMKLSLQVLQDVPMFFQYIDSRMRYGLDFASELQLLRGSGVGSNISGLMTNATAFTGSSSGTQIDILRRAQTQLQATEFVATGIVLHPSDWEAIELLKDSQLRYIIDGPSEPIGPDPDSLWSLPIVITNAMTAGSFLVADFPQAALLLDRQEAILLLASENVDDFERNLCTARIEQRLGLAILRPGGLIKGTF
jgi:HK97 family phage major capsid protein